MKKETWKLILQLILSIITAIATTLGVTSRYSGCRKAEGGIRKWSPTASKDVLKEEES